MLLSLRSHVTASIAIAGASLIAVVPLTPPPMHVQARAVQLMSAMDSLDLSAGSDLTSLLSAGSDPFVNPIATWLDVFTTASANLQALGAEIAADPFPILSQISANQMGYDETLSTALQGAGSALETELTTALPQALQMAFDQITSGDPADAANTLNMAFTELLLAPGIPLLTSGVLNIPQEIAQNEANAFGALTGFGTLLSAISGLIGPPEGALAALGDSAQGVVTALGAGDFTTALSDLVNAPAVIEGAFLNGYDASFGTDYPGLLSPDAEFSFGPGTLQAFLVDIPQAIAAAITPSTTASAADLGTVGTDLSALDPGLATDFSGILTDLSSLF
jgi:hypothetical protein